MSLPSALETTLRQISQTLSLPMSDEQVETLLSYITLLQRWNATYNLTAVRQPEQMLTQHIADCLAIIAPLVRHANGRALRLLDVGSGGGLPGIVIAAMLPGFEVTCVDAVGKKAAFVRQAAGELRLSNLHSEHARVEQMQAIPFDLITSRAFASLADFVRLTGKARSTDGVWLAMKGKVPTDEMAALPESVEVFHVEHLAVPGLAAERCLVWMRPELSKAA